MPRGRKPKQPCRRVLDENDDQEHDKQRGTEEDGSEKLSSEKQVVSAISGQSEETQADMPLQEAGEQSTPDLSERPAGCPNAPWKSRLRTQQRRNYAKDFEFPPEPDSEDERRRKEPTETELSAAAKVAATWTREEKHVLLQMIMKLGADTKQYAAIASVIQTRTVQEIRSFMQRVIRKVVPEGRLAAPLEIWQKFVDGIVAKHCLPDSSFIAEVVRECAKEATPPTADSPHSLNYTLVYRYIAALIDGGTLPKLGALERQAMLHLLNSLASRMKELDKGLQEDYLVKNFFLRLPTTDAVVEGAKGGKGNSKGKKKSKKVQNTEKVASMSSCSKGRGKWSVVSDADMPEIVRRDVTEEADKDILVRNKSSRLSRRPPKLPTVESSHNEVVNGNATTESGAADQNATGESSMAARTTESSVVSEPTESGMTNEMINVMNWSKSNEDVDSVDDDKAEWVLPSSDALTQAALSVLKLAGVQPDDAGRTSSAVDGSDGAACAASADSHASNSGGALPDVHPAVLALNPLAIPSSLLPVSQRAVRKGR